MKKGGGFNSKKGEALIPKSVLYNPISTLLHRVLVPVTLSTPWGVRRGYRPPHRFSFTIFFMFHHEKLRLYVFLFLAFAVLSSKNILIYNEETLVALSFFCFVFFVLHYFGNTMKDSLNERGAVIRDELQNFLILKEHSFQELLSQHKKVSGLTRALGALDTFTKNELNLLNTNGDKALKNMFRSRIQNKLKTVAFSKGMVQQKLQFLLSENILSTVLVAFPTKGKESTLAAYQNRALKNALDSLIVHGQKN